VKPTTNQVTSVETAIAEGVTYVSGEAIALLWNNSTCIGVRLEDGGEIAAESTVVATGCWTLGFLGRCNVSHGIPSNVAGVTVVGIHLSKEQYEIYKDMPVLAVPGRGREFF
jgi:glycine/D-amino acid oxidase-like deaminating enzyme